MTDPPAPTGRRPRQAVMRDEDWEWLGEFAARHNTSRGAILRRAVGFLRRNEDSPHHRLHVAVMWVTDPMNDPLPDRTATLIQNRGATDA
jgi:hypothetical protein